MLMLTDSVLVSDEFIHPDNEGGERIVSVVTSSEESDLSTRGSKLRRQYVPRDQTKILVIRELSHPNVTYIFDILRCFDGSRKRDRTMILHRKSASGRQLVCR
jgi:hypothetical protein